MHLFAACPASPSSTSKPPARAPRRTAITEIGIVRVDLDGERLPRVTEWSTLVDPEVPIPPAIQALTGITDAMVAAAPTFSTVAGEVAQMLAGCVFVAHNARFDYGFLKHAFARLERPFAARVLCTVRLSRRLFPDVDGHGLDALIARHSLAVADRHRALGDARAIWSFVQVLYREPHARATSMAPIKRILRIPSLPPQLAAGRARRAARGARRLSVLRRQSAAALHRQEHQPARARRRAFLAATGAARPTCGCRRRSAASSSRRPPASSARCCAKRC